MKSFDPRSVLRKLTPGAETEAAACRVKVEQEFRRPDLATLRSIFNRLTEIANLGMPALGGLHTEISLEPWSSATADIFVPNHAGPYPVLIYLHGGAWVAGNPASHRLLTAHFASMGYLVISVDYALAPEHPFPAGLQDCVAAVRWAACNAERFGGDPARMAIGGDSAGGNLAAATALTLRRTMGIPRIHALILIYGVFDMSDLGSASRFLHDAYLRGATEQLLQDHRVSPLLGAHKLPPSFILIGTQDNLLDQNRALRDRLASAGLAHEYIEATGMPHGFMQMEILGRVRGNVERAVKFLEHHIPPRAPDPGESALSACGGKLQIR